MEIRYADFCRMIATDNNLDPYEKHIRKFEDFPIVKGVRKISSSHDAIIVDREGKQHPYMIDKYVRNNDKLIDFDYLFLFRGKSVEQLIKEAGITIESKPCKISEGGGWYSNGTKYFYKEFTCEI